MLPWFVLLSGWIVYFFLHSWLAADRVKEFIQQQTGKGYRYYRLGYSILSTIGLLAMLICNAWVKGNYLFQPNGVSRYISLMLASFGVIIIKLAFKNYSLRTFIGLTPEKEDALHREGILNRVRHPIYSGTILIVIGYFLFTPNLATLVSCVCIFIYLAIGITLEEKKLVKRFGDSYRDYQKEVPMLISKLKW